MDANNMYVGASRDMEDGAIATAPSRREEAEPLGLLGASLELSARHESFTPPTDLGEWPPRRLDGIGPGSGPEELSRAVEWVGELAGWFHSIDLPGGVTTPGGRGWESRARAFDFARRMPGARVLDLGAMEGGDSFAAEAAGADTVTACDVDNYFGYDLGRNSAWDHVVDRYLAARARGPEHEWAFMNAKRLGFELCSRARGSKALRVSGSVYDLDPRVHGTFDVVCCFGLLYHLRHPLLAIDRLRAVTESCLLVNNQVAGTGSGRLAYFDQTWRGSHTNWFVPTPECFLEMLSSSGFCRLEVVGQSATSLSVVCHV